MKKKKPTPVSQHPLSSWIISQFTAFLKPQTLLLWAFRRPCWFHLLWHCGRRGNLLYLLYCSVRVDVVVVFVQSPLNEKKKYKENRLIPTTSCLWRQEEVTVAILFLSTQVWMSTSLHSALDTTVTQLYSATNIMRFREYSIWSI